LATRPAQASRLRQRLQALRADYDRRLESLLPLRQLLKGSVYQLKTRCGKPSCHCASRDGPLHLSTVLSWSQHGRTRLRTLAPGDRVRFARLAESYRRFRQARAALTKLHRQILATVDRLELALLVAPPPPPARKRRSR
jgi:hypothetical protein